MGDIENLFGELLEERGVVPTPSSSDKIIITTEVEFGGENYLKNEEESRKSEEESLRIKKKELMNSLRGCKNIKNAHLSHINQKRSEKRKQIKKEMAEIDLRLQEIEMERTSLQKNISSE